MNMKITEPTVLQIFVGRVCSKGVSRLQIII